MPLRPACARVVVAPGPAVWPDRARDGPSPDPQPRPFETLEGPFAFHGPVGPKEVRRGSTQELTGASGGRPCGGRPPITRRREGHAGSFATAWSYQTRPDPELKRNPKGSARYGAKSGRRAVRW